MKYLCHRLNFFKADSCVGYERFRAGELWSKAFVEERAFRSDYDGPFAALFLMSLAVLVFVVLRR
jgi:hypothetical protein